MVLEEGSELANISKPNMQEGMLDTLRQEGTCNQVRSSLGVIHVRFAMCLLSPGSASGFDLGAEGHISGR